MSRQLLSVLAILAGVAVAGSANAAFLVSYEGEAAGVQNTTATFSFSGVETFDALPTGTLPAPIVQTFTDLAHPATTITAAYSGPNGVQINPADQYGGAGGTGNYIVAFGSTPYTLNVSSTGLAGGVNYFGFWLSALDAGNQAQFYDAKGDLLFTFKPQDVLDVVTRNVNSGEYYGNPNAPNAGANAGQPYIFLNFFDTSGSFSKVVFQEIPANDGGYESDNHTFGHYTGFGQGTIIPLTLSAQGVPEPASWTMMLLGAAGLGAVVRRRRSTAAIA